MSVLAITYDSDNDLSMATDLAQQLNVILLPGINPADITDYATVIWVKEGAVLLQQTGRKAPGPVSAEFASGAADHRRKFGGGKGQMIAKAVGVKAGVYPQVLDATAGLGQDAFVLASLGCRVQLLERNPVVASVLLNGLHRAREAAQGLTEQESDAALLDVLQRMHGQYGSLLQPLDGFQLQPQYDVVYLDPMFPARQKSASVKKAMSVFHSLVGSDPDADALLPIALQVARYRVAVKRPRKAPFLNDQSPSYQLLGKSSRYDIYTKAKLPDSLPIT